MRSGRVAAAEKVRLRGVMGEDGGKGWGAAYMLWVGVWLGLVGGKGARCVLERERGGKEGRDRRVFNATKRGEYAR